MSTADLTYELLKRMQVDISDIKREQISFGLRLASLEQHLAATQIDIARMSSDIAYLKKDVDLITRRLDLVEA